MRSKSNCAWLIVWGQYPQIFANFYEIKYSKIRTTEKMNLPTKKRTRFLAYALTWTFWYIFFFWFLAVFFFGCMAKGKKWNAPNCNKLVDNQNKHALLFMFRTFFTFEQEEVFREGFELGRFIFFSDSWESWRLMCFYVWEVFAGLELMF